MKIGSTVAAIENELLSVGTVGRAAGEKRYLKSDLEFVGANVPQVRKLAKTWLGSRAELAHDDVDRLVRALWRRRVHELRSFGIELLVGRLDLLTATDLDLVEWIMRRANTWAHIDPVAVNVAGPLVENHPELGGELDRWVADESFWLRRSALLVHLLPLRRGEGDWQRFARYADRLLEEKEFFIRKAIGWVLRESGKVTPVRVIEFLEPNLGRISGLTLREATRHLDADTRERLTAGFSSR
jgi:3-methyladenine DNA glycosylase AlkD